MSPSCIFKAGLLRGKVAMVSGGGTGIGFASALELGRLGATIVLCGRREDKIESARAQLQEKGISSHARRCDIREPAEVESFVDLALEKAGRIDVVKVCASKSVENDVLPDR